MSAYEGHVTCPRCGEATWRVENWSTYLSVVCANQECPGFKLGEIQTERNENA